MMLKRYVTLLLLFASANLFAQKLDKLTVEKIMRDPKWMGSSPSGTFWSNDGTTLYFLWNPDKEPSDSLWYITTTNKTPVKATAAQKQAISSESNYNYNEARTAYVFAKDGDVIYKDVKTGKTKRITQTVDLELNPQFSYNETKIVYTRSQNLYAWDIASGETMQLSNVKSGDAAPTPPTNFGGGGGGGGFQRSGGGNTPVAAGNQQEQWLKNDQLKY